MLLNGERLRRARLVGARLLRESRRPRLRRHRPRGARRRARLRAGVRGGQGEGQGRGRASARDPEEARSAERRRRPRRRAARSSHVTGVREAPQEPPCVFDSSVWSSCWRAARRALPSPTRRSSPNVRVLATGGTIAGAQASATSYGYKSGAYDVNTLISAVPNLDKLAAIIGRAGREHRQPGHERRGLAHAREAAERCPRRGRHRRGADHARHRHARGDQLLPEPRHQEREAGGDGRLDAPGDGDERRRPGQHLQRRRGGDRAPARGDAACSSR